MNPVSSSSSRQQRLSTAANPIGRLPAYAERTSGNGADPLRTDRDGANQQHRSLTAMMNTLRRLVTVLGLVAATGSLAACSTVQGLLPGSDLAANCTKFRDEIAAHAQANPALNGNLDQAANAAWGKKNQDILERFLQAAGVTVNSNSNNSNSNLETARATMTALAQASAKCKIAGVNMINP